MPTSIASVPTTYGYDIRRPLVRTTHGTLVAGIGDSSGGGVEYYYSSDDGSTWTIISPAATIGEPEMPYVLVDDASFNVIYAFGGIGAYDVLLESSAGSMEWDVGGSVIGNAAYDGVAATRAGAGECWVLVRANEKIMGTDYANIELVRTTWDGSGLSDTSYGLLSGSEFDQKSPRITTDSAGNIHIAYRQYGLNSYYIWYAKWDPVTESYLVQPEITNIGSAAIGDIIVDGNDDPIIATDTGLARRSGGSWSTDSYGTTSDVTPAALSWRNAEIWALYRDTTYGGIYEIHGSFGNFDRANATEIVADGAATVEYPTSDWASESFYPPVDEQDFLYVDNETSTVNYHRHSLVTATSQTATATVATGTVSSPLPSASTVVPTQTATADTVSLLGVAITPSVTPGAVTPPALAPSSTITSDPITVLPGALTATGVAAPATVIGPAATALPGGVSTLGIEATATTIAVGPGATPGAVTTTATDAAGTLAAPTPSVTTIVAPVTATATVAIGTLTGPAPAVSPGAVIPASETATVALQTPGPSLLLGPRTITTATASGVLTTPQPGIGASVSVTTAVGTTVLSGPTPTLTPGAVVSSTDVAAGAIQPPIPSLIPETWSVAATGASVALTVTPATGSVGPVTPTAIEAVLAVTALPATTGTGVVASVVPGIVTIQGTIPEIGTGGVQARTSPGLLSVSLPPPNTETIVTVFGVPGTVQTTAPPVTGIPGSVQSGADPGYLVLVTDDPAMVTGFVLRATTAAATASVNPAAFLLGHTAALSEMAGANISVPTPNPIPGPVGAIAATGGLSVSTQTPGLDAVFDMTASVAEIVSRTSPPAAIPGSVTGALVPGWLVVTGSTPEAFWDLSAALDLGTLSVFVVPPEATAGFPTEAVLIGLFSITTRLDGQYDVTAGLDSHFATSERLLGRESRP